MKRPDKSSMGLPKRAAIYCRVSSSQQEEDGTSLATQDAKNRAYAEKSGYTVDPKDVYLEVFSGVELWRRPKLQVLRESIRRREIDVVVAYAIDRLTRDAVHLGVLISEAEHDGVDVEFVSETLDGTPEGALIRYVRGYAASVEHEKIRERTARGRRSRVLDRGKPLASQRPRYGLAWRDEDKSGWVEDPITGPIARRIWREALAGSTLRSIANGLSRDGISTPSGRSKHWSQSTIKELLADPVYMGRPTALRTVQTKSRSGELTVQRVPASEQVQLPDGIAPVLVEPWQWEAVQARLARNKAEATRNSSNVHDALLRSGFVRCGNCGTAMVVNRYPSKNRKPIYKCSKSMKFGPSCPGANMSVPVLDQLVWSQVESIILNPELIAREVERIKERDPIADDMAALDATISGRETEHRRLLSTLR